MRWQRKSAWMEEHIIMTVIFVEKRCDEKQRADGNVPCVKGIHYVMVV